MDKEKIEPIVVITQPTYLSWLGYFEQLSRADCVVFLDDVQFERRSWQCRNRLKDHQGKPFWLTVPLKKQPRDTPINEILISADNDDWKVHHMAQIQLSLGKAPFWGDVYSLLNDWLSASYLRLVDLNLSGIQMTAELLDIKPNWKFSSTLKVGSKKGCLILDICKYVRAKRYYSAYGSKDYLDPLLPDFADAGILVDFQKWQHPQYSQQGKGFVSHLAAIDAIANLGVEKVKEMFRNQGKGQSTVNKDS